MVITHHGGQCFKVTLGDLTLAFDPIAKGGTLPAVRFGADIALVSRNHPDLNGVEEASFGDKQPFAITGPGEYELKGVTVRGFLSKSQYGLAKEQEEAINTIYAVELEDMRLVHLGALLGDVPPEAREVVGEADILFVPVGGDGVLAPAAAHELAVALEPKVIIPMHWSGMGQEKSLDAFLKASGSAGEKMEKLTLKKRDLVGREGAILILTP
ncbi:MAG: MBL fold metallo-hydrolase [Patescibacteria group bacterium]|nr:MBL fold metallo-hydrolase [Patescibacteria group bacterium]MDE1943923.1 MBL fold metallo-hydrolase [Patescibacteria group bacterium]MDE1944887.1 MBL fold metallo-hydrolase [Patescibacteria group bacterium]MDE2057751.1 MBL fold metallo-hydrolase [Patescibacteria group bacterium]